MLDNLKAQATATKPGRGTTSRPPRLDRNGELAAGPRSAVDEPPAGGGSAHQVVRGGHWGGHGGLGSSTLASPPRSLLQVNSLDCQDTAGSTGPRPLSQLPCPSACVTLSKSLTCLEPGLLKSHRRSDPYRAQESFKHQQQGIKGGAGENQLRERR